MGTNILVPDADFSASSVGFNAAVSSGLVGLWFFNRGIRESRRNLALGGVDAEIFGTPSDQGDFIRFKGAQSFFQTAVEDTEAFTHIVATKSTAALTDSATSPMMISNFGSGSKAGFLASVLAGASIYFNASDTAATMGASRYTDATETVVSSAGGNIAVSDAADWHLLASRARVDRSQRDNLTAVTSGATNYPTSGRVLAAGNFRIGGSFSQSFQGECDIAAVAMYNRFVTDGELATMAMQLRNVLAHIGVTV